MDDEFESSYEIKRNPLAHPYDNACEYARAQNAERDAREWFDANLPLPRTIYEFSPAESKEIIDSIYARGGDRIFVLGDDDTLLNGGSIDMVLIELPMTPKARSQLFELNRLIAEEHGFDADVDEGQKYMLLRWT